MCLTVERNAKPQKAIRDITVYKVLKKVHGRRHDAESIFKVAKWYRGNTKRSRLSKPKKNRIYIDWYDVNEGLHAFRNITDAREFRVSYTTEIIVKMTIPKGSSYYIGTNGYEIAATRMHWPSE